MPPNSAVGSPASADAGADVSGPPQYWPGEQLPPATEDESPLMSTRRLATWSVVSVLELGDPLGVGPLQVDVEDGGGGKLAGLEHFFVEQDEADRWPGGSLASAATSFQRLRQLLV